MSPIFGLFSDPGGRGPEEPARRRWPRRPNLDSVDDLGVKHRVWTVYAAGRDPERRGRDVREGRLHRRRASPVRDGARVPRRDAREARREPRRGVRARADVPVQHGRRGDRHPADAPRGPFPARASPADAVPFEGPRAPPGGEPRRLARGRDAGGGGGRGSGGRPSHGARAATGTTWSPSRIWTRFCDKHLSKFPPQLRAARRRASPRVPVRAAARDLPRGGDGGAVRQVLQGPVEGGRRISPPGRSRPPSS